MKKVRCSPRNSRQHGKMICREGTQFCTRIVSKEQSSGHGNKTVQELK